MLTKILSEMQRISHNQLSGVLFLVSGDNRSAQISFENGKMVFAMCQGKKGQSALAVISEMNELRCRFQEGVIPPSRIDMPSIPSFIVLLQQGKNEEGESRPTKRANTTQPLQNEEKRAPTSGLEDTQKRIIHDVLAECIGPMASILCEDHLNSKLTVEDAIEAIADEIPIDQVARFKNNVLRRLQ